MAAAPPPSDDIFGGSRPAEEASSLAPALPPSTPMDGVGSAPAKASTFGVNVSATSELESAGALLRQQLGL